MREATCMVRPFGQQNCTFAVIVETELFDFGGLLETVEVSMNHWRIEMIIALDDRECRRRHFTLMAKSIQHRTRESCFSGTKTAG